MQLRHFFENMVKREETASAFLATLLDYDPEFRTALLRLILDDPAYEETEPWTVAVEAEHVDVVLESSSTYVLIEDKISPGAKQHGQLLRYYRAAVESRPTKRIVAVYLAPGGMGTSEVEAVEHCAEFVQRDGDIARHLPWKQVARLVGALSQTEHSWFARSGIEEIERAIAQSRAEKFPPIGGREVVREVCNAAIRQLAHLYPDIRLGRWSGEVEVIRADGPVTLGLQAVFDIEPEYPHAPLHLLQEDGIHLTVRTQFKKAGKVRRGSELDQRWVELTQVGAVDVPGAGRHELQPDGWFVYMEPVVGSAAELQTAFVDRGRHVLDYLRPLYRMRTRPD